MNDCTDGMFILSYLLDPVYYDDGALRLVLPPRQNFSKGTVSALVKYLITSARKMLQNEQKREQKGDATEGDILVNQIVSYMYREAPFDNVCTGLSTRLTWWKSLAKDTNSRVLARLGIKLFSVVPSEMCDERTASKLTATDTARRNNLSAENLVRCAQLNHSVNRKPSDPIVAGIPTLRDLLNPDTTNNEPVDEEALFNAADPYGIEDLEAMEEGEDETDTSPPPLVIWRNTAHRI
ncbi:hypothetical protein B0H10DRAFT_2213208 [Mycena sp. CBHHK59/15]|nr:hypothetical protein B0H10DRAFT_2240775 [Mycena sp. CBHHK59/15]KAJ6623844.1 hypothetical protein B0H10DRAFT_2213208 [Mycena sp. CBHHK59/15]